jgi:colanic acid/amylovoran biosynthesis protein
MRSAPPKGSSGANVRPLGVSLSGLINEHYMRRNPAGRSGALLPLLAAALDTVAVELDVDVVFIPHVTGPARSKDDRVTALAVGRHMKQRWRSIGGDYGPDELKGLISRFSLFLGARMHANIAALSSGVPTVALSYSHKTEGIMQSLQQSARVIGIDTLTHERVTSLLRETWRDREDVRRLLLDQLQRVTQSSRRNVELILDLIRGRGAA